ncbi:MAG: zinc-ribbon and FHA domain-containing protein [Thermoleophilia bacterium]|nr:zinc-ribbon and FHA domain-containing protein [Thermoleophilia bacterium]
MYCTACGHQNGEDANYCAKCGSYLVGDQNTETIPVAIPGVGRDPEAGVPVEPSGGQGAALVIRSGGGRAGEHFRILDKTTIGRSPTSDIFLDDVTVSREHAVVYNDGASIRVEDRASLNGTFVNHERVEKRALEAGDEIQIGKYKLTYLAE